MESDYAFCACSTFFPGAVSRKYKETIAERRKNSITTMAGSSSSSKTHFWSEKETRFMLNQLKDMHILQFMDGRKTRNGDLFKKIAKKMEEAGFRRNPEQIRIRWKNISRRRTLAPNRITGRVVVSMFPVRSMIFWTNSLGADLCPRPDKTAWMLVSSNRPQDPEATETLLESLPLPEVSPGSSPHN
ncbi:unnamed protein product [Arctogadus glacialis]